jgi:imidazolonepropionase-like amidohydrolase
MRRMLPRTFVLAVAIAASAATLIRAQPPPRAQASDAITILKPARVFDGETMHEAWAVRVKGERIEAVGSETSVSAAGATVIDLPGTTLTPGLVEGHSHILLHAYSETSCWRRRERSSPPVAISRSSCRNGAYRRERKKPTASTA